jgi:hypothetical protein
VDDRELLELAAKAAGWTGWQSKHGYWNVESPEGEKTTHCHNWNAYCPNTGEKLREPTFADAIAETNWNPLTDDGDALRLAVKCRIEIGFDPKAVETTAVVCAQEVDGQTIMPWAWEELEPDPYAATRRAIVRAAAYSVG